MSPPGDNHQLALDRFLSEHPEVASELDTLNPLAAQAKGETLAQYRAERLHEAFEAEAERQGLFAWELTLKLTAESPQAFEAQRLEVHKEVAQMAGLSWAEYCQLHDLPG
ncbi:DNA repair protein [Pseudomonas syringae]|uniref:DNA repair protein n=1 Tax=Pseudomonas syringae TaxID=317 RepID=A0A9Q3ZXC4_PSESX|nr:DNA repair protein [Pseudomonas syringae]MCF5062154.1 DNA repair protein [Pseudomonas syringae]MCF5076297.1 DNA repair protein [Pseudomonas syringae]MCF5118568.1 DNA repair protein [Pseudomonas syringae]MCF5378655.1 DNA repair protein [Pseudomonas syringae]